MARIRTIKPEFWQDEKLSPCDPLTRLVFLGLVSLADDAGRLVDNLRLIDAQIFPNTADTAHEALMRLSRMGRIRRGKTASGQRIIELTNWNRHQKIQHPNLRGALPEIVEDEAVADAHEALMSHSRAAPEPLTHHTNDQRPEPTTRTNDHMPPDPRVGRPDAVASAAAAGTPPVANRVAAGSAAVLHQGTAAGDSDDEPAADGDPITGTGMSLADASQITVSLSGEVKPLGEISVPTLRKLLPLAWRRGNVALVEAISVVIEDREQLARVAS